MIQKKKTKSSTVFKVGTVSLAFLIIGYQAALFVNHAAVARVVANRDRPDTVYVYAAPDDIAQVRTETVSEHSERAGKMYLEAASGGETEPFRFNPNTASADDFMRLGFSEKQAESIVSYVQKGGRFRRKSDFARSYVVSDAMFRRLEPFIDIPLVDINRADSAAFDALPGIGAYFASKMVSYREALGGYSYPEQLTDIWNFGQERYDGLKDLICCSTPQKPFALWSLPEDSLAMHPYIHSRRVARSIVLYRENTADSLCTLQGLRDAGILSDSIAHKLSRCLIEDGSGV